MSLIPSGRIVIIGVGMVGASIAYSIINRKIAKKILIIDIAEELAKANVLDLEDAAAFLPPTQVQLASYQDIEDGDLIIVTSGAAQKEGQTRLDLLQINAKITRSVVGSIKNTGKNVYLMMVANPVDVLTYIAVRESGLPEGQVFGSGTYLDSGRLGVAIARKLGVAVESIRALILGEHGDSSLPWLSAAKVDEQSLSARLAVTEELRLELMGSVRSKAYEIIKGKKATYYGIGVAAAQIANAIINDTSETFPLSVMLKGQLGVSDIAIGYPASLSAAGYVLSGEPELDDYERELFQNSVKVLKENIALIN